MSIEFLDEKKIHYKTLLAQVADREGVDAVVMVVRINNRWSTCWSDGADGGLNLGGLSMAAMKLFHDIQLEINEIES